MLRVPYPHMVLGGEMVVTNIDQSQETVRIANGSNVGTKITIKGKGFQRLRSKGRGDFIVTLTCDIPKSLSSEAEKLLRDYARELDVSQDAEKEGFLSAFFKKLF